MNVPNLSLPSVYHEAKAPINNNSIELNLVVISPSLEPHGIVRSTRRARVVGVALELYHSKIYHMLVGSKIDFCDFCVVWAGQDNNDDRDLKKESESNGLKEGTCIENSWSLPYGEHENQRTV